MVLGGQMPIHEYDSAQAQRQEQGQGGTGTDTSQRAKWVQKQREWRDRGKAQQPRRQRQQQQLADSPELQSDPSMIQGWGESTSPSDQRALLDEMGRAAPHTDGKGGFPQRQVHSPRRTFQSAQFASTS